MYGANAIDNLANSAGKGAGGYLAFLAKQQQAPPQPGNDGCLDKHNGTRYQAEPVILGKDEHHCGYRLAAEENRLYQHVADKTAERFNLVLDHGRHFRRLHPAEVGNGGTAVPGQPNHSATAAASAPQAGPCRY